jgi:hypothetical protein
MANEARTRISHIPSQFARVRSMANRKPRRRSAKQGNTPSGFLDRFGRVIAVATATVTLVSAIAGLVFVLYPRAKPERTQPPAAINASVTVQDEIPRVPLRRYLALVGQSPAGYSNKALQCLGNLIFLGVQVDGARGVRSPLLWTVYRPPRRLLADPRLTEQRAAEINPPADRYRAVARLWIPLPPLTGDFFARIELWYRRDILAYVDTTGFSVSAKPCPPAKPKPPTTTTQTTSPTTTGASSTATLTVPPPPPPPPPTTPPPTVAPTPIPRPPASLTVVD